MKEATLRKYHRFLGMSIALLVVIQTGTGLLLSLSRMTGSSFLHSTLTSLHFGDGGVGNGYRIALASALFFMVSTGGWISLKMYARSVETARKRAAMPSAKP